VGWSKAPSPWLGDAAEAGAGSAAVSAAGETRCSSAVVRERGFPRFILNILHESNILICNHEHVSAVSVQFSPGANILILQGHNLI